jgi:hypothetical protein
MEHTPLHAKQGATLGAQVDQHKVAAIAHLYADAIQAGTMTVEHISEMHLGGGKYVRSFVIQE